MTTYRVIGQPTQRSDGPEKVTGQARYSADVLLPGTLWGKTLLSPHAHARITRIDTAQAAALPGVLAVITGADVGDQLYGRVVKDIPVLAGGVVRFIGERVAAVAAVDRETAQQAVDLIEVDYEPLLPVFDPLEALESGAPVLHPNAGSYIGIEPQDVPSNAYHWSHHEKGDLEQGMAEADLVIANAYRTQRQHQLYMEPQNCTVWIDDDDRVQVWTGSKVPYNTKESLAAAVGIAPERVLLHHTHIGGDFGGKGTPSDLPICYFLAAHSGRPVKMLKDYVEEFTAGNPRHEVVIRLKTGVKRDGTMTAHHVEFFVNCGAYAGYKPRGLIGGATAAAGPYRVPHSKVDAAHVYTNTVPGGFMRAPGDPQGVFAIESHIDEIARQLEMDPLEFRRLNLINDGEESASGDLWQDVRVKETLEAAIEASGYRKSSGPDTGWGVAIAYRAPGGGQGTASVTLGVDGSVAIGTPIYDQGTSTYTTLQQVVAEEFGVAPEQIRIDIWETDAIKFDSGVAGSRATRVNTIAAYEAAQAARLELASLATDVLGWPREHLTAEGGSVRRTDTQESMSWQDLVARAGRPVTGQASVDEMSRAPVTAFVAQVAEVGVDPETGQVRLVNFTTAHDIGEIVNPIGHQGQIDGAVMQGIGYALMEELTVEDGRVTNVSFADYKAPTVADIPPMKTVLLPGATGVGPYGIKGIGENPVCPVAPAIANAVADATGVRIRELPITAEKVHEGLRGGKA